jgi:hypothetical protein
MYMHVFVYLSASVYGIKQEAEKKKEGERRGDQEGDHKEQGSRNRVCAPVSAPPH